MALCTTTTADTAVGPANPAAAAEPRQPRDSRGPEAAVFCQWQQQVATGILLLPEKPGRVAVLAAC